MKRAKRLLLFVVLSAVVTAAIRQAYWEGCQDGYYLRVEADDATDRDNAPGGGS